MINENIDIIIPPVWSGVYINTARLIKYSLEDNGFIVSITETANSVNTSLSIILGWNLLSKDLIPKHPFIIYQLEPLILPLWRNKINEKIDLFNKALSVWDYSESNVLYLNKSGIKAEIVKLGYHPEIEEVAHSEYPDYDVLFVGFLTERRKKIIDELNQFCCVSIHQRWGKDFSEALGRTKILLNLHQYEQLTPIEQPRVSYALNNRIFVLSESSADNPYSNLATCDYNDVKDNIMFYLHNAQERIDLGNTVFRNFMEINMANTLRNIL
jgi:hypothetical protein